MAFIDGKYHDLPKKYKRYLDLRVDISPRDQVGYPTVHPPVKGKSMLEKTLEKIADRILALDEASLASLWEKYRQRMECFDATRNWERATIVFFIINAVRAKNQIFNDEISKLHGRAASSPGERQRPPRGRPALKLVNPDRE